MLLESDHCETLDSLIDDLDQQARIDQQAQAPISSRAGQRRNERYRFRAACTVRFLMPRGLGAAQLPGRTRNLSRSGVGLLVRRVFAIGEIIEVELHAPGRPTTFMAGVVCFCRYAGQGFNEIGVLLKVAAHQSVICGPPEALEAPGWAHMTRPAVP